MLIGRNEAGSSGTFPFPLCRGITFEIFHFIPKVSLSRDKLMRKLRGLARGLAALLRHMASILSYPYDVLLPKFFISVRVSLSVTFLK